MKDVVGFVIELSAYETESPSLKSPLAEPYS